MPILVPLWSLQTDFASQTDFEVVHPLLVCTYTNVAVDNLVEGLVNVGLKPLRIGSMENSRSSLREHTLEYKFGQHPNKPDYDRVLEELKKNNEIIMDTRRLLKAKMSSEGGKYWASTIGER